jgi:oligopeptidase B
LLARHGDERTDPWYWLHDPEDPGTLPHLEAENAYTEHSLAHLAALRERLYQEMVGRIVETDRTVGVRRGPFWYYGRTVEGRSYAVHCRCPVEPGAPPDARPPGLDTPAGDARPLPGEQVLLDENELARGHDFFAVGALAVSPDHRRLAYSVDTVGNERYQLRFARAGEGPGPEPPETIADTSYGLAWASDNATVFYTRVDQAMRPFQVWRHRLGTDPEDDVLVLEEPDARFTVSVWRTKDGAQVLLSVDSTSTSEVSAVPADRPETAPVVVQARRQGIEYGVDHLAPADGGPGWWVQLTNEEARDFRLLARPTADGSGEWREVAPHRPGVRLEGVDPFAHHLVLSERAEAETRLRIVPLVPGPDPFGPDPLAHSWLVPGGRQPATTWEGPNPEPGSPLVRFEQTSLADPRGAFDLDLVSGHATLLRRQPVRGDFDPGHYRTWREWVTADDGTAVPVSLVERLDRPEGPGPLLLYGYGAYEHSIDPAFSSLRLSLLDRGVTFAVAHVRGGGEMGRAWYEDGRRDHKPNTFTDFVAVARHLVAEGRTAPDRLVGRGGSAGGLLIGAVANLAPELFCALVAEVPFVDVLTTMQDPSLPLTVGEWEEWGDPVDDPAAYALIKSYSPYDNVRPAGPDGRPLRYPAVLATAGLHDSRVGYWEPAKWVARLREANPDNSVLLKVELGAGHGGPSGRYDAWREEAFVQAFVLDALGLADAGADGAGAPRDPDVPGADPDRPAAAPPSRRAARL